MLVDISGGAPSPPKPRGFDLVPDKASGKDVVGEDARRISPGAAAKAARNRPFRGRTFEHLKLDNACDDSLEGRGITRARVITAADEPLAHLVRKGTPANEPFQLGDARE